MPDITGSKIVMHKRLDLKPYEKNSRIHSDDQIEMIANSIKEWGFTIPILVDQDKGVIAGHGRLFAADKLEMEEVPCIVAKGWSEAQKRAYVIADNQLAERSEWNNDLYWSELQSLIDDDFDVDLIGVEIDPTSLSYEPNVTPISDYREVSSDDILKAEETAEEKVVSLSRDRADDGISVMCPYCAESFKVSR
jgi:hypothetical protein